MNIILHMGDPYPDESPCAKRMRTFYEEFQNAGHSVKVLAPKLNMEQVSGKNIYYCPTFSMKKKTTLKRLLNSLGYAVSSFFISFQLGKADVVITTSPPPLISISGWLIGKIKGARVVYDVRDIWPDVAWEMGNFDNRSLYSKVFEVIRDFMLKHSDLVTAVSKGKVTKLQMYEKNANVLYVTNGLDEQFLNNPEKKELLDKYNMNGRFNCVYVGNLGLAQGLHQLLHIAERAQEKYSDVQFLLFGSGVEEDALKAYVRNQKLDNVVFAGRLPNVDMYTILKNGQMSFVSLVNKNLKDSVPTKMYEALGVGCPVLLSAVGDSADILRETKLGIPVKPNDDDNLWAAFENMYLNIDKFNQNKSYAQKVILEHYSRQRVARKFEKQLRELFGMEK